MNVLIACEESQRTCTEFRKRGHNAYSNDIVACSGGHPEWHILMDSLAVINGGVLKLQNGEKVEIPKWDLIIAHPPCTYLSNVATRSHSARMTPMNQINARTLSRISSMDFFMRFVFADCEKIAIENPIGIMNTAYRAPDQIIHPYQFVESESDKEYVTKATCLWLKGLNPLETNDLPKPNNREMFGVKPSGKVKCWEEALFGSGDGVVRSKTFFSIARAFAEQWG